MKNKNNFEMSIPNRGYICNICGRSFPISEGILHQLNCRPSSNNLTIHLMLNDNNLNLKTQKNKTITDLNPEFNFINNKTNEQNFQNNENMNTPNINNITNTIRNNNVINTNTIQNEEFLNSEGIMNLRNIESNYIIGDEIQDGNMINEYYTIQNIINNNINSIDGSVSFANISINNNNPVERKVIENLFVNTIKDITKFAVKNCAICLENYKNGDNYIILPCIHLFHFQCINDWMKIKNTCPICGFRLTIDNIKE